LGAYQVLDELSKTQGKSVGPPTAYRALDFLVENGFAFKIVSRNAYVRCEHLGHDHHGALLICSECGLASEIESPELDKAIHGITSKAKFRAQRQTVEIEGVCARCRAA
jgi:Fur family zinc uptake transcriptional regulator